MKASLVGDTTPARFLLNKLLSTSSQIVCYKKQTNKKQIYSWLFSHTHKQPASPTVMSTLEKLQLVSAAFPAHIFCTADCPNFDQCPCLNIMEEH